MSDVIAEYDKFIHREMLVHPALFSHTHARTIAILDSTDTDITHEVLKHSSIKEVHHITAQKPAEKAADSRLQWFIGHSKEWLTQVSPESVDVIIIPDSVSEATPQLYQQYLTTLRANGMLIQQCDSPYHLPKLKTLHQALQTAGFHDTQLLQYPQPNFPWGFRSAFVAIKQGHFPRAREKDIFNKSFNTRYYNFDVHKAAFVLPEFMREELAL